jgi:hypothetical protein
MTWKPYINDRLIKHHNEGFVVITPVDAAPAIPLCCPVCNAALRTREDESAYIDVSCCNRCALLWAHARRKEWKDGWRPTQEQIHAAELVRPPLSMIFDID